MRITIEEIDRIKQIPLPNTVGLINRLGAWIEQKVWPYPESGSSSSLGAFKPGHWLFPAFRLKRKHQLFLQIWPGIIGSLSLSPVYWLQVLGFISFYIYVSQFFIINLFLFTIHLTGSISLENSSTMSLTPLNFTLFIITLKNYQLSFMRNFNSGKHCRNAKPKRVCRNTKPHKPELLDYSSETDAT